MTKTKSLVAQKKPHRWPVRPARIARPARWPAWIARPAHIVGLTSEMVI